MTRLRHGFLVAIYAAIFTALVSTTAFADDLGQTVVADGVLVYLGITPSKVLRSDPKHYAEHNKQCPVPGGANNYHVMVALFDKDTGKRIVDADVFARVSPLGLAGLRKHFAAHAVAGAMTYCNYFNMPPTDRYKIDIEIKRPGSTKMVAAKFTYRP